jgi:hypothetical protein
LPQTNEPGNTATMGLISMPSVESDVHLLEKRLGELFVDPQAPPLGERTAIALKEFRLFPASLLSLRTVP